MRDPAHHPIYFGSRMRVKNCTRCNLVEDVTKNVRNTQSVFVNDP
jgi:hypothetical protein